MRELNILIQAGFFIISIFLWIFNSPYYFRDFPAYAIFLLFLLSTSIKKQDEFKEEEGKAVVGGLLGSLLIALFLVFVLEPMFNQNYTIHFAILENFFDIATPGSSYMTIFSAIIFYLAGFLGIRYITFLTSMFKHVEKEENFNQKSILAHAQLIPIFLFPLFIFQIIGRTELLEPTTIFLYRFSITLLFLLPYCFFLSLLGSKLHKLKFIWITSIFSLISFSNAIVVAFQFVITNIPEGAFALGTIISWLLCTTLGIIVERYGNYPISTWLNSKLNEE